MKFRRSGGEMWVKTPVRLRLARLRISTTQTDAAIIDFSSPTNVSFPGVRGRKAAEHCFLLHRRPNHQHWIDGHPTADLIDLGPRGRALEGVLAVQVHVGPAMEVQCRYVKIKHLPDDFPLKTAEASPIPDDVYGVGSQGKLPKDWKAPVFGER